MPVYYLSKKMLEYELNYTQLEKTCLALVWATQWLWYYLLSQKIFLISRMDPMKYMFEKPALIGRTALWLLMLSEFDITYVTQKSVKSRIITEQLADALTKDTKLSREFSDERIMLIIDKRNLTTWTMYFDEASNSRGKGISIVLVSPRDEHIPISIKLDFDCTNNVAEYKACIAGLEAVVSLEVQDLDVYGDSLLIICQTNGNWLTKEDRLILYHAYLTSLMKGFHNISFTYISRLRNRFVDALATLASMVDIPVGVKVCPLAIKRHVIPAHIHMVQIAVRCPDGKPWYFDIKNLISGKGYPPEASLKEKKVLHKLASRYVICGGDLYRRSFDGVQLLCVNEDRAAEILEDVHSGVCGPHMNDKMLARKILRLGYFWTTLKAYCFSFVKTCHLCQIHANLIHVSPTELHSLTSLWPLSVWGIDIIGKVSPKSSSGHDYILVAINYFTKWIEAQSYTSISSTSVPSSSGPTSSVDMESLMS
ncbi:uncharacterized protein LOC143855403 [Tasmannia lanceolata]|uniref:uncharacterized protein LOC143855403 n=1 Tax=Tasmannia lanceolata TaxID=3420 RepID=UPI00406290D8